MDMTALLNVGLYHYLVVAGILFALGAYGVMTSRNVIRILICVELMLNAVNINLVAFNNHVHRSELAGQVFAIFVLVIAAAEAAVGMAVVIALYRLRSTVDVQQMDHLRG